jgi:hypothetical protein
VLDLFRLDANGKAVGWHGPGAGPLAEGWYWKYGDITHGPFPTVDAAAAHADHTLVD